MLNRRWVWGMGLGALAAAAGGVVSWSRLEPQPQPGAEAAFWALELPDPMGLPVAVSSFAGRPLLLNFWATWCPPCVEELPLLNAFYGAQRERGWQVVGIAIDKPESVRAFVQRIPLDFPLLMAGLPGTELSKQLGNSANALPFTVVFNRSGEAVDRRLGKVDADDLAGWAKLVS